MRPVLRRLDSFRFPAASSSTLALAAAIVRAGLEHIDRRREILKTLPEGDQLDVTADGVTLALEIRNAPPIECQGSDVELPVQLGNLQRNRLWVGRALEGEQVALPGPGSVRHRS